MKFVGVAGEIIKWDQDILPFLGMVGENVTRAQRLISDQPKDGGRNESPG